MAEKVTEWVREPMKRVLIVEDDLMIRENLVEVLEMENFVTLSTMDGVAGLELAQEYLPDIIICDVMLPGLNGYSLLDAIRKNMQTAAIPFIFLSAKAAQSDLREGMSLGADDYLTKPYTTQDLLDAINARLIEREVVNNAYSTDCLHYEQKVTTSFNYLSKE
jgi:DNA-binding response OmpR family regulator